MARSFGVLLACTLAACAFSGCGGGGGGDGGNDGVISFTAAAYSVNENGVVITTITVQRVGGTGDVSVTVTLSDGTATSPSDYDDSPIVLAWLAGDLSNKTFIVPVVDDHDDEPDEFLTMTLGSPTGGAVIGTPASATLTIADDDVAGILELTAGTYTYAEDGTTANPITVVRAGGMDGAVSVTVISIDGTANSDPLSVVEPVDYTPVAFLVSFADQSTTPVVVPITIANELLPEQNETFTVQLVSPTNGAVLGPQQSAVVTITDDDPLLTIDNPGFLADPGIGSLFGSAVAKQGPRLVIGAPNLHSPSGLVWMYDLANLGTIVGRFEPLTTEYGKAVAPHGPQGLLVGSSGKAFRYDDFVSAEAAATVSALDGYGSTIISLQDGRFAVGAPDAQVGTVVGGAVVIHDDLTGQVLQTLEGKGIERLGQVLVRTNDGLFVGATGSVQRFSGNPLTLVDIFDDPYPGGGSSFGAAIGVFGSRVYVGAPTVDTLATNDGRVYIFEGNSVQILPYPGGPAAESRFGSNILVLSDGRFCVQQKGGGAFGGGIVFMFNANGTQAANFDNPAAAPNADFGAAMCELDGAIAIGAPNQPAFIQTGQVFIFRLP